MSNGVLLDKVNSSTSYFTEIEEHFRQARGTALFRLSPLDWALVETWKDAGVPVEAVHKGIDRVFEKWRARKHKTPINSLSYCAQEVWAAASRMDNTARATRVPAPAFSSEELARFFRRNAETIRQRAPQESEDHRKMLEYIGAELEQLAGAAERDEVHDLEAIEQRLDGLEERMITVVIEAAAREGLLVSRQEVDRWLAPYRSKMTTEQLALLEKQYLERQYLERRGLPRLSLFYLS